jgi:predicted ATPase
VSQDLKELGLTWKVSAIPLNDTQVELQVARLPQIARSRSSDMVSIADVGFGVSQTLPVVVALREAKPGQLVYLEQPEIHLHPRAQTAMAKVLADAARRGVHVVAETHSALLILGIQTLVAEGKLAPELIKLHWFERKGGVTKIKSADLDETGSFGDWPEDFADIALEAQSKYLDAVEARMTEKKRRAS